ncbi:glycosyltransferase [Proteus mirabilis]|uniref:glycosyltransferase n=1 Tax=Proteus mirabilis TaxID=584 RepID=UPI001FAD1845|nr:glycosyltransferase [Proteus mirabilis]MCI9743561.1 glycosyltransferase [Proteus mirabilis]MCI9801324.1 glycosyltransferase [Proteus mirabilis]MCI9812881.1 glycosyltransferase [Proteus mirabilis]
MNIEKIKASIIILCYNQEKTIKESLLSAINQDYNARYNIIICDDGSEDNTLNIINDIVKESKDIIVLPSKKNKGIANNFNKAIPFIHGDFFITQAGDDISLPNRLSITDKYLSGENYKAFFSATIDIDSNSNLLNTNHGKKLNKRNKKLGGLKFINCILNEGGVLGASAGYKASIVKNNFLRLSNFSEDKILTARAASVGNIYFFDNELVKYRKGSGVSITNPHYYSKSMAKLMYRRNRFYKSILSDSFLSDKLHIIKNVNKRVHKLRFSCWLSYRLLKNKLPLSRFIVYVVMNNDYNNITARGIYQFIKSKIHVL